MDRQAPPDSAMVHDPAGSPESRLIGAKITERPDLVALANPCLHIGPRTPPFLIMHGTSDRLVPFGQSEALAAALQAAGVPVDFRAIEGADHVFDRWEDHQSLFATVAGFLETVRSDR
jgi:dipeptidyl aminopeptidase/acylaminoacyl peptidase